MRAFNSDPALKATIRRGLAEHREADRLVRGVYYDRRHGRGCGVGCTLATVARQTGAVIKPSDHSAYATHLGIPTELAWLEDMLFERLSPGRHQAWPERFIGAIQPGADLSMVWPRLAVWLLRVELAPHYAANSAVRDACHGVAALYERIVAGLAVDTDEWRAAEVEAAARVVVDWAAVAAAYDRIADQLIELLEAAPATP